jgi:hemolysin III
VWGVAALGVTVKILDRLRHPLLSTGLYVALGWVVALAAPWMIERMPAAGLAWLAVGGVFYTVGAGIYLLDQRLRYAHFVFHLLVLGGSSCHFFAALGYARG